MVTMVWVKGKGKDTPNRPESPEGDRNIDLLFLYLGDRRGWVVAPRPIRFTPGKDPVHIVQDADGLGS
jgi:hypothetical protein